MAPNLIDLRWSHDPRTPDAALSQLRADCAALGIQAFDMYGDYANDASWLQRFQAEVAARLGFNRALFVPSGVMAQNIALKVYEETSGRHSFAARYNSHLFLHEHDAYKHVLHLDARVLPASAADVQAAATFNDVKAILESDDLPAVLFLELPEREIGGKCIPFDDLVRISEAVRAKGIALHMDGARLWEAEANYAAHGHSLHDVTALFDSVYVSFYKGLGAITGAMLLGSNDFIDASKVWLRRFGGNLYSQLPYAASSWAGFRAFPASVFAARRLQLRTVVAAVSAAVPSHVVPLIRPCQKFRSCTCTCLATWTTSSARKRWPRQRAASGALS
ncbi:hypothetical protein SPRG_00263 [Saprolegnia parasitica CBS 223.65]|uniref:Aromatic amino acid beta-eliminating lyase/threonine aldolase domain-containing protein n=1 Tax=Saprolegnia parasitica (strain CBS 223.65) TaxID=695850 RepID=A0A067D1N4_SAPPC|nr:hypothetical protein SPRG_00263 [Saprolegnia parasitica CBS 223.65]KDO35415.1 hypothetical protein SPRG_00263 [Saprolegnia parasitica CBS 223.65]|eukprot:XP_012193755.1 hypothetical protein SPRG_00263 [Saprolegnia parasitica CBS 223.65]